jgi:hypothetical protein
MVTDNISKYYAICMVIVGHTVFGQKKGSMFNNPGHMAN